MWVCAVERVKVGSTKRCFPQGHPGRSRLTLASKRLRVPIKVTLCLKFFLSNLFSFSDFFSFLFFLNRTYLFETSIVPWIRFEICSPMEYNKKSTSMSEFSSCSSNEKERMEWNMSRNGRRRWDHKLRQSEVLDFRVSSIATI